MVQCKECGANIDEVKGLPLEDRKKCPNCGSLNRAADQSCKGKLEFLSALKMKGRRGGQGKPFLEVFTGWDYWVKMKRWVRKLRIINREKNTYLDHIEDPKTGNVIHHDEEDLSRQRGYGSAKTKDT